MSELRYYGFKMEVENASGVKKIQEFRRAVTDVDATVEMLNDTLGDNVTVTAAKVQGDKEALAQARLLVTQQERQRRRYEQLNSDIQNQLNLVGKSSIEQAKLNAVQRLGADATEEQRQKVSDLAEALARQQQIQSDQKAISDQQSRAEEYNRNLQHQISLVGKNSVEQAKLNAVYKLGANATEEQRQKTADLARTLAMAQEREQSIEQAKKDRIATEKRLQAETDKQSKKTEEVIAQYQRLNRTIEEYGTDLETVNAITRLGSNATDEQRREVAQLVQQYQQLRSTGDAARNSMRNMRGVAQNLGWQMQDIAVQLQMGTNGWIVFSQQGSQVLSSLGAWGALAGAAVAIIGASIPALTTYFNGAKESIDAVKDAQQRLNSVFDQTSTTVNGVSKQIKELYEVNSQLAELQLFRAMADAQMVLRNYGQQLEETLGTQIERLTEAQEKMSQLTEGTREYNRWAQNMRGRSMEVANALGITSAQARDLATSYTEFTRTGDNEALTNSLINISRSGRVTNEQFRNLVNTYIDLTQEGELAEAQLAELRDILNGSTSITDSYNKTIETTADRYRKLTEQLGMTDAQIAVDNYLRGEGNKLSFEEQSRTAILIAKYHSKKAAIEAENAAKREQIRLEQERQRQQQREFNQLQKSLTGGNTPGMNPVDQEAQRHAKNLAILEQAKQDELNKNVDFNALIEAENTRHTAAIQQGYLTMAQNWTSTLSGFGSFMENMADVYYNGTEETKQATENMTGTQKAFYVMMQAVKAAEALVNGVSLGMQLAALTANPAMVTVGTTLGAASAGMIMGTTFAGAFDKGGYIPSGSSGIVSEYGDELVNGVMVKGPARVTGREETAAMMNNGTSVTTQMNVSVENYANGVSHEVQQVDENSVRVIAKQIFDQNIDSGVATSLSRKNSRSDKAMRKHYNSTRTY